MAVDFKNSIRRWTAAGGAKDPRVIVRAVLGILLVANLVAAVLVVRPPGGSPEDLEQQLSSLRAEVQRRQVASQKLRALVDKVEKGRAESELFLEDYFLSRRTASSTIITDLTQAAQTAGMKPKEHAFVFEAVEGSDNLTMMTISANYEGNYSDLVKLLNLIDRASRLLILESLQAAPLQATGMLNVNLKLNTFVRERGVPGT